MDQSVVNNTIWVLFCTALVFLMQAGFCRLETGLSRSKNSINVAIKNVVDFCVGAFLFWFYGCALMFGGSSARAPVDEFTEAGLIAKPYNRVMDARDRTIAAPAERETDLERAKDAAEAASRAKSQFLADNAVKFTPQGGVKIVTLLVHVDREPQLRIEVSDTGIGMSQGQISHLFGPFEQADTSMSRSFGDIAER